MTVEEEAEYEEEKELWNEWDHEMEDIENQEDLTEEEKYYAEAEIVDEMIDEFDYEIMQWQQEMEEIEE